MTEPNLRLSISFSGPAARWLRTEAAERATSVSDVVRRIVDEVRQVYFVRPRRDEAHREQL